MPAFPREVPRGLSVLFTGRCIRAGIEQDTRQNRVAVLGGGHQRREANLRAAMPMHREYCPPRIHGSPLYALPLFSFVASSNGTMQRRATAGRVGRIRRAIYD